METPDQNKIVGKKIASGRAKYMKFGDKADQKGYIFKENHGFAMAIDEPEMAAEGITMEAILDCIKQLEEKGDAAALKKEYGFRKEQSWLNPGLVLTSRIDPRIQCSVTLDDNTSEDVDIIAIWFLDNFNQGAESKGETEREVDGEELKLTDRMREMHKEKKKDESRELDFFSGLTAEDVPADTMEIKLPSNPTAVMDEELDQALAELEESSGKKSGKPLSESKTLSEAGEADQDYDKGLYDAVTEALEKEGFEATHREFDKYQGVSINVKRGDKEIARLWTVDSHLIGEPEDDPNLKYKKAVLIGDDGESYSASRGDYFNANDNDVIGSELRLTGMDGEVTVIENPKKKDLPDLDEVQTTIRFKGGPDDVLVLQADGTEETASVRISNDRKEVDLAELLVLLNKLAKPEGSKKKETKEESISGGTTVAKDFWEDVDFYGLPNLSEDEIKAKEMKAGSGIGEKPKQMSGEVPSGEKGGKAEHELSPEAKDREVEGTAAKLKGKDEPNKVGQAIGDTGKAAGGEVKSGESALPAAAVKPGKVDAKPAEMEGSTSAAPGDGEKPLPAAEVKPGKPGSDPKHMEEGKRSPLGHRRAAMGAGRKPMGGYTKKAESIRPMGGPKKLKKPMGADEVLEKYVGFKRMVSTMKQSKNPPRDPKAVAAVRGREKYGSGRMARAASAHKRITKTK